MAVAAGAMARALGVSRIGFRHTTGPRNQPARKWLSAFAKSALPPEGELVLDWTGNDTDALLTRWPIKVEWK